MTDNRKPLFEHTCCTRCGGSGKFSFNLKDGDRCYGCAGSGYKLTKRGNAAQKFLDDLQKVSIAELKIGDLVWFDMLTFRCCAPVTSIEPDALNHGLIVVKGIRAKTGESIGFAKYSENTVMRGVTSAEKQEMREKALAYQATLTKQGVPSKRIK